MKRRIATIVDVTERQLCAGCGACASVLPESLEMVDVFDHGRRPVLRPGATASDTASALEICPGVGLGHGELPEGTIDSLVDGWGPALALWEGHATDDEIRFRGSSGGAATALALHALEHEGYAGVVHTAARADVAYLNETIFSTTRDQLVAATGSRYAPASPCDRLADIEAADRPCVFIGKPCDVAAAHAVARTRPALARNLGLTIAVFCAGTPSTRGTFEMIDRMRGRPEDATAVRYRGHGWPGRARVDFADGDAAELSYDESWGLILQQHRQWRCYVCADHVGEFADVAVGDPWYRELGPDERGSSLVIARTERGRAFVEAAIGSGVIELGRVAPEVLPASQPNLLHTRGAVWGRILALRATGTPAPRFRRMPMFRYWRDLPLKDRAQSVYGTWRRILRRRLYRRVPMVPMVPGETPTAERRTVLAISSGGGHWVQLLRLRPAFAGHDVVFATVNESSRADVAGAPFHRIVDATRWERLKMVRLALQVAWLLARLRPDVVVSTGAAPGYLAIRLGRLIRARTVWIDSIANAEELSLSGRKVGAHADLWLTQWEHLAGGDPGPEYAGSVL